MTTLTVSTFEGLLPGTWAIDPSHSEVGFTVRHLMSKVRGRFHSFEGVLQVAENPLESTATATIDLSSVDTGNADRDNHLRSGDFFSVESSPTMRFVTTGIREQDGEIVATGDLTIKDVTRPVDLQVEYLGVGTDPWGGSRVGLEATTTISRKEWGITFNIPVQGDKLMIGDAVSIMLSVQAVRQA